jgi:ribosomal protein S18 acetylase RimI-like enzyme
VANIRNFRNGDEPRMKEIAPRAFGVWTRLALDKTLPKDKTEEYLRREVTWYISRVHRKEKDFGILVAEEGEQPPRSPFIKGDVVGYIVVGVDRVRSEVFGFSWGHIISLAVDPTCHGRGIGSALIASGLDWLRKKGVEYVEVLTDQNNIAAIRAYEKNNFRVIYSSIVLSQYL